MRKLLGSATLIGALALTGCAATNQPNGVAVQGYQSPGGWGVLSEQKVAVQADIAPGQSAYMGASADGSLVGFIFSDGTVRWYKTAR